MKPPTDKKVEAEIKKLEALKPKIPRRTMFGDDNHEKIDAQIRVLEERMDEDAVYSKFEDPEDSESTMDLVSNAREAAMWLEGQSDDPPSKGWKGLAKIRDH